MADLLEELATYIAGAAGFTLGEDLYANIFPPDKLDQVVVLIDGGGKSQAHSPLSEAGGFDVQVLSRSLDPQAAKARAWQVHEVVHGQCNLSLGTWWLYYADEVSTPRPFPVDSRGRYQYINHYLIRATKNE